MTFLNDIGLGLIGMDFIIDGISLATGRDPYTGEVLTSIEMGLVVAAFIIPVVSGTIIREMHHTQRMMTLALRRDQEVFIRSRPVMAWFWQAFYRQTGLIKPKPTLNTILATVWKGKLFGMDTGLRLIHEENKLWLTLVHSDLDIDIIFHGNSVVVDKSAKDLVDRFNKYLGSHIFDHTDIPSGIRLGKPGANLKDFNKPAFSINWEGTVEYFDNVWDSFFR